MTPCELTMSIAAAANAIACQLSDDQLAAAASVFSYLGSSLAAIAVERELCQKRCRGDDGDGNEEVLLV